MHEHTGLFAYNRYKNSKAPIVGDSIFTDSIYPLILGFVNGLQFIQRTEGTYYTNCYQSVELTCLTLDSFIAQLALIYLPSNWANLAAAAKDFTDAAATISNYCNFEILIDKTTGIFSI